METEKWKVIRQSPDYSVSTLGRVRSNNRWLVNRKGVRRFWKQRIMTPSLGGQGYLCIVLIIGGIKRNLWLHRLVAETFIRNPQKKRCVNHKDLNKKNNRKQNLEWATHKENMEHAVAAGCCESITGSNQHMAKLTESAVREIRRADLNGEPRRSIRKRFVRQYKCNRSTIDFVLRQKTWKWVTP